MNIQTSQAINPSFTMSEQKIDERTSVVVFEPLEQGYGHTLGNALRRVLLTSLPGYAITQFRVEGADHLFTSIEGVSEDALELSLNIKQVRLQSTSSDPGRLSITANGPKTVTAGDIECSAGYEVVNPDQVIATLAKGCSLTIEMKAEQGMGYELASERKAETVGDIPVDSLFSPVVTVSYKVEATRVGRRTDFDKLFLTVQTNGSITPVEAVKQAAALLARQFSQVVDPVVATVDVVEPSLSPEQAEVLRLTVEELDLPTRIANALRKGGFATVGDLSGVPKNTIAKVKNLGEKSVSVVDAALQKKGVSLGD